MVAAACLLLGTLVLLQEDHTTELMQGPLSMAEADGFVAGRKTILAEAPAAVSHAAPFRTARAPSSRSSASSPEHWHSESTRLPQDRRERFVPPVMRGNQWQQLSYNVRRAHGAAATNSR